MTAQPTRDQLLDMTEDLGFLGDRPELCDQVVGGLWAALTQAERHIARLEAQTQVRGRAVIMYRERAREAEAERDRNLRNSREAKKRAIRAEARIKAVQDVLAADAHVTRQMGTLGQHRPDVPAIAHDTIRRALDG